MSVSSDHGRAKSLPGRSRLICLGEALLLLLLFEPQVYAVGVVINEILSDAIPGHTPFVELYNGSPRAVDVGGWRLGGVGCG